MTSHVALDDLLAEWGIDDDTEVRDPCCGRTRRFRERANYTERLCINRCCVERYCECGAHTGGWGPVGCRCERGGPNPLPINGHAYRRKVRNR
jgi:hypothetical protein